MTKWFLILFITCAYNNLQAQVIINTIAGQGKTAGFSGDGGLAIDAKLNHPENVCINKYGDIYIVDAENNRIRKIIAATGIITTIAGTGVAGYNGDNIPATNAQLFIPMDICIDTAENIFVSDILNRRIRKINSKTGVISTIAGNGTQGNSGDGGQATDAQINGVTGLSTDKNGNLYLADNDNNNVRMIDVQTGVISTIAGTGITGYNGDNGLATNATLHQPCQISLNSRGDIFISDNINNAIRRVDHETRIITTIAGTGTEGHSGDGGPATSANLRKPYGISVDYNDNLFIAEFWNGVVRRIDDKTGIIITVAGFDTVGYSGDGGPATAARIAPAGISVDKHGTIFISDYGNHCIRKVYDSSQHYTQVNNVAKNEVKIYPNPASDELIVEGAEGAEVKVYNVIGHCVMHMEKLKKTQVINIARLVPGTYVVSVVDPSNGVRVMNRVVKE